MTTPPPPCQCLPPFLGGGGGGGRGLVGLMGPIGPIGPIGPLYDPPPTGPLLLICVTRSPSVPSAGCGPSGAAEAMPNVVTANIALAMSVVLNMLPSLSRNAG